MRTSRTPFLPQGTYEPMRKVGVDDVSQARALVVQEVRETVDDLHEFLGGFGFKALESISILCGVGSEGAAASHKFLNDVLSNERMTESIKKEGMKGEWVNELQRSVGLGAQEALDKFFKRDPPGALNVMRRLAQGNVKQYRAVLGTEARAIEEAHGSTFEEAVRGYAEICGEIVSRLEQRVKLHELTLAIRSYGVEFNGDLSGTTIRTPSSDMKILTTKPREFLGAWGSTMMRASAAFELLYSAVGMESESTKAHEESVFEDFVQKLSTTSDIPNLKARSVLMFAVSWVMSGLPVVQPSHRLAASLMGTHVPSDLVPEIAVPWPAFLVEVPDGLIPEPLQNIAFVGYVPDGRIVYVFHKNHSVPFEIPVEKISDLSNLRAFRAGQNASEKHPSETPETVESMRRGFEVLGRLLLGAMIELDDPEHKGRIARGPSSRPTDAQHRSGKTPSAWIFQLQRPISVDARSYVREYVARGRQSLKVQSFVRGHSKRQPYGPKGSLRKWIQIEPYWKGDENAPIALRTHKVKAS